MSRVAQDPEVILSPFSLFICLLIFKLGLLLLKEKVKILFENPSNDDIQGVMIRVDDYGSLWQVKLNWGQHFMKMVVECFDYWVIYACIFAPKNYYDVN